ncbi:MAG: hypothetical protein ABFD12_12820, partial [Syntrophorhabdus sp.]
MKKLKQYQEGDFTWFLTDVGLQHFVKEIVHRRGERRSYSVCDYAGMKIFVKTFAEKGTVGRLRSWISPRGTKELVIAQGLNALNIPAPVALGYGLGPLHSAIVETFIDGKTFLEMVKNNTDIGELLVRLARFLLLLKENRVRHDDLHLDNVLVSGDTFYLIDLHKVRIRNIFSETDEIANLKHALGSIYYDINPAQLTIFFEAYGASTAIRRKVADAVEVLRDTWVRNKMARAFRDTS